VLPGSLLVGAVAGLVALAYGLISGRSALQTPVLAGVQILADATSVVALACALRRRHGNPRQHVLLWLLLASCLSSLLFTVC
jgi:hypothetical protein